MKGSKEWISKSKKEVKYSEKLKQIPICRFKNCKCTKFECIYGLASFNHHLLSTTFVYILECTPHRIVVCFKQRVRLLLDELHNLILFRVAAAANISLRDCSRAYASHSQNLRLGWAPARLTKLGTKLPHYPCRSPS